jgi:adenylate cyclase
MVRAGDLFGDGVNIAARLQSIAKPGGVCISGATYDQVRKVLPVTFEDLGVQQVKNIQEPIRAFQAVNETREPATLAHMESLPPLPDKPSIAVLPFQKAPASLKAAFMNLSDVRPAYQFVPRA